MKSKDARLYLEDIRRAIERIKRYTADGKRAFFVDEKTQDAVIRQLAIIGEAAGKLPRNLKANHPEIAWKNAVGMRNILIHDYAQTSIERVWDTIERDLPPLFRTIKRILQAEAA